MKTYTSLIALSILCSLEMPKIGPVEGPDRTGISKETDLLREWPEGVLRKWSSTDAGMGYSGFSVVKEVYTMGAFGKEERLLASTRPRQTVWSLAVGDLLTNGWGDGPRMTPTVADGKIYALGGRGDGGRRRQNGRKFGASAWSVIWEEKCPVGNTESVLVDEGRVICTISSKGALAALDADNGKLLAKLRIHGRGSVLFPHRDRERGKRQYVNW